MHTASDHDCFERLASLGYLQQLTADSASETARTLGEEGPEKTLNEIEKKLSEHPDDLETRLWWLRLQLELSRVPSAVLSAPLEELYEAALADTSHSALSSTTYLKAGCSLLAKKQIRLALLMIERSIALGESGHVFVKSDADDLDSVFAGMLESEKEQAPLRRESKEYIASLPERILEAKNRLSSRSAMGSLSETSNIELPSSSTPHFTSKSILAAAIDESTNEVSDAPEVTPSDRNDDSVSRKRFAVFASLCLVFFTCLAGAGYLAVTTSKNAPLERGAALYTSIPKLAVLSGPTLSELALKVGHAPAKSKLDSVGARIKNLAFGGGAREKTNKEKESPEQLAAQIPDSRGVDEGGLESLNKVPDKSSEAIPVNKVPQSNPERFAKTRVSQVGTSPRKTKAPVAEKTNPGSGSSGAEAPRDPYSGQNSKTIDGTPMRSYQVQRFDPPKLYKTITSTSVLATPSLLSKAMARLENGSHIHCTRKMGPWLEILSLQGKIGYILAQDASPASSAGTTP